MAICIEVPACVSHGLTVYMFFKQESITVGDGTDVCAGQLSLDLSTVVCQSLPAPCWRGLSGSYILFLRFLRSEKEAVPG